MLDQSRDLRVYIGHCWFVGRCALWRSGSWQRGWTARSYQATNRWSRAGSTSRVNYWTCIWRWGDVFRKLSGSYQASKVLEIQPWFWGTTRSRNSRFVAVGFTCVWQVFFSQNLTTPCSASCQTVDSLNSKTTISAMTEHEQKPSTVHRGPWSLCLLYIYIYICHCRFAATWNIMQFGNMKKQRALLATTHPSACKYTNNTVSFNICDCIKWCSTFNIQYIHISLSIPLPRFYMCLLSNYIFVIYDKFTPKVWTWHNSSWSTAEAVEFVWAMKQQGTKSPLLHLTRHSVTSCQWRLFQAVEVAALHASFSGLQLSLEAQRI